MRITSLAITDYKRIRTVSITPDADKFVILIGGKNGNGKSSTLDALTAAFGGAKAGALDPVRHGQKEAAIFVELDGGKLTIDRTFTPDGKTKIEVRDPDGAIRSPQAMLDGIISTRFLDPLAFLQLAAKEQRAALMRVIPDAARIAELDAKRLKGFDRRTEIGRELTRAEGELARLVEVPVGVPIDVGALAKERSGLAEIQRAGDGMGIAHRDAMRATSIAADARATVIQSIARLEEQLVKLQAEMLSARSVLPAHEAAVARAVIEESTTKERLEKAAAAWAKIAPRGAEIDAEIERAAEHNRAIAQAEATNVRRGEAAAAAAKLRADRDLVTAGLAEVDKRKAAILAAAKLPVAGLAITDEGIELAGVPLAQASDAERWRVSLAIAIAGSPELDDVWIKDGALLDDDSLAIVAGQAESAGKHVWIERVGTRDAGVIEIRDGHVAT